MKKTIFFATIMAFVMVSCNQKNDENATHKMDNDGMTMEMDSMEMDSMKMNHDTKTFACSMHPEVHGKLNDTCHKCGMKLTEPVEK
jgi:nitrous oxide reductase accessory protein NosL